MDEEQKQEVRTLSLVEILEFREVTYKTLTESALLPFEAKLNAAVLLYLKDNVPIKWIDVDKLRGLESFAVITGYIFPLVGTKVMVGTDFIDITDLNVQEYRQTLRFILPIKLLEIGTVPQIYKFIMEISALASVVSEQELNEMLRNFRFDNDSFSFDESYNKMLAYATRPAEMFGFNTKNLSEEQITSLAMFNGATSETKN